MQQNNRLMVLSDNGKTSRYTYNHAGKRIVKSHGDMEGVNEHRTDPCSHGMTNLGFTKKE